MSIKSLLMPAITARLFSHERLLAQRAKAERQRSARGEPHRVWYFHQVDDPYSALVAQHLPRLVARYDITLLPHVVDVPADTAAPERDKLVAYSRRDAAMLARRWRLHFDDASVQPSAAAVVTVQQLLVAAIASGCFTDVVDPLSRALWQQPSPLDHLDHLDHLAVPGSKLAPADASATQDHIAGAARLRQRLGHYLGATLYYAGEWYWGLDRLHHLERRLQALGAQHAPASGPMFAPEPDLDQPTPVAGAPAIDFFLSLRSPYTAIVAPRVFRLGELTGAPVRLRYVLPMAMRGLPVPRAKRLYIMRDAAREARLRGIAFGRINDPLGKPTERGLALIPLAERAGQGQAYLLSFLRGVWSEGIDAGSDRGLRRIAERADLSWSDAQAALHDPAWRMVAEANRGAMFALGLWGVPSFRAGDTAVWGQDRLWAIEQAVLARRAAAGQQQEHATA